MAVSFPLPAIAAALVLLAGISASAAPAEHTLGAQAQERVLHWMLRNAHRARPAQERADAALAEYTRGATTTLVLRQVQLFATAIDRAADPLGEPLVAAELTACAGITGVQESASKVRFAADLALTLAPGQDPVLSPCGWSRPVAFGAAADPTPDMNEGGPPGRFAPSASPLVLPHVMAGQSPAITSGMNED